MPNHVDPFPQVELFGRSKTIAGCRGLYWIVRDDALTNVVTPSVVIPYPEKQNVMWNKSQEPFMLERSHYSTVAVAIIVMRWICLTSVNEISNSTSLFLIQNSMPINNPFTVYDNIWTFYIWFSTIRLFYLSTRHPLFGKRITFNIPFERKKNENKKKNQTFSEIPSWICPKTWYFGLTWDCTVCKRLRHPALTFEIVRSPWPLRKHGTREHLFWENKIVLLLSASQQVSNLNN